MTCKNCDPSLMFPGKLVKVTPDLKRCSICGDVLDHTKYIRKVSSAWDSYFHNICVAVASKSPCLSRKIGAILVKDHSIISTGYNGPPRGIPHCGQPRLSSDKVLSIEIMKVMKELTRKRVDTECPRKLLGYPSGTHMELCPAQHAEANAISNAARIGAPVLGSTLYMNCVIPCKNCFGALINAGIVEIVVDDTKTYDIYTQYLIDNSSIKIREFNL